MAGIGGLAGGGWRGRGAGGKGRRLPIIRVGGSGDPKRKIMMGAPDFLTASVYLR